MTMNTGQPHKLVINFRKMWGLIRGVCDYNFASRLGTLTPKAVLIGLTYWCNSRCVMCNIYKMKPKDELRYEEWESILKDPIFKKIEKCSLTGGEVSLHPQLLQMVGLFIRSMPRMKKLSLVSHGFMTGLIVDRVTEIAKICNRHRIGLSVTISLDGVGNMHEKIRRIPDAFEKTTATLFELTKLAKKYHFWVGSISLVLRQNLPEVEKMKQWYKKNNVDGTFQVVGFHDTYLRNLDTKEEVNFRKKEQKQLEDFMARMAKPKSLKDFRSYYWNDILHMYRDHKPRTTACPFQYDQFALDSFGDVYNCFSERKIGNCRDSKTISDIYFDPKNLKFKQWMLKHSCRRCNSGCDVEWAVPRELKRYLWFRVTGRLWYGAKDSLKTLFRL